MTILSTKAGVKSRLADFTQFTTIEGNDDVMSKQAYGSVTITQLAKGVEYANVQSAIEDVRNFTIRPINSIEINTDGISPEGISQVDQWEFTGDVTDVTLQAGDPVIINVYGFPVHATVGDTAEDFANKVALTLNTDAVMKNFVLNKIEVSSLGGNILNVTYIDNQVHNLEGFSTKGITVVPTTLSPAKAGYGAWNRIGTRNETLDGSASPITFHYFKRYA